MCTRATLLIALSLLAGCGERTVHEVGGPTMGSSWSLKYSADVPPARASELVAAELAAFDVTFSRWRDDSEIAAINRSRHAEPIALTPRFATVLAAALEVAAITDGAFDPTVAPLSRLFQAAKGGAPLDRQALAAALPHVGWRKLELRDGALRKLDPEVELDLDGIVAGACLDSLAEVLAGAGIHDFLLDVTGENLARGSKPDGSPWLVGVVDPDSPPDAQQPLVVVPLRDGSLCTSGTYRNRTGGGADFHHVFDPRTGDNPTHRVVSASVLMRSATFGDAYATALLVMSPEQAAKVRFTDPLAGPEPAAGAATLCIDLVDGRLVQRRHGWPAD